MNEPEINLPEILERLEDRIIDRLTAMLQQMNVMPVTYPEKMTTRDVAQLKGCLPVTVQRSWQEWGLQRLGRVKREFVFSGVSVQRHIERLNHHA